MNDTLTSLFLISQAHPLRILEIMFLIAFFLALIASFIYNNNPGRSSLDRTVNNTIILGVGCVMIGAVLIIAGNSPSVRVARSIQNNQLVSCYAVKNGSQTNVIFELSNYSTGRTQVAGRPMVEISEAQKEQLDYAQAVAVFNWLDKNQVKNEATRTLKLAFQK